MDKLQLKENVSTIAPIQTKIPTKDVNITTSWFIAQASDINNRRIDVTNDILARNNRQLFIDIIIVIARNKKPKMKLIKLEYTDDLPLV